MAEQIRFFEKSKIDISETGVEATASQGADYAPFVLNRSNNLAWVTSGSVDADNTTLTVTLEDEREISCIFLLKHNFKNYTVKYWNGSSYVAFSTPIAVTNNTADNKFHEFDAVSTTRLQITITGTMTADDDKYLYQFIATNELGQLAGWPVIDNPVHGSNIKKATMLSGKAFITRNVGAFAFDLTVKELSSDDDLTLFETLYSSVDGFLVWLCGGDEAQFSSVRVGYRFEDVYLMKCVDEYQPEFVNGLYQRGIKFKAKLQEVVPT